MPLRFDQYLTSLIKIVSVASGGYLLSDHGTVSFLAMHSTNLLYSSSQRAVKTSFSISKELDFSSLFLLWISNSAMVTTSSLLRASFRIGDKEIEQKTVSRTRPDHTFLWSVLRPYCQVFSSMRRCCEDLFWSHYKEFFCHACQYLLLSWLKVNKRNHFWTS